MTKNLVDRRAFVAAGACTCWAYALNAAANTPWGTPDTAPNQPTSPSQERTPWGTPDALPPRDPPAGNHNDLLIGCYLNAAAGSADDLQIEERSGMTPIDYVVAQELDYYMLPFMRISPACGFYHDDNSPNAFATPQQLMGRGSGTVVFGLSLMKELLTKFSSNWGSFGKHAVGAVFAHECGHILQFANGMVGLQGKQPELHADFIAGWYTGSRSVFGGGTGVNFDEVANELFSIGDFAFNSPQHHGTPTERVASYKAGVQYAFSSGAQRGPEAAVTAGREYVGM